MATQFNFTMLQVKPDQLRREINDNETFVSTCLYITTEGNNVLIVFNIDLTTEEEVELNHVVEDHSPEEDYVAVSTLPISDVNKLAVHASPKPLTDNVNYVVWTGAGDNIGSGQVGDGDILVFEMTPGVAEVIKDVRFDPIHGKVWIHEGFVMWANAGIGDNISSVIMGEASPLQTFANLDLVIDENHWVKPAPGGPGTGTHGFAGTPTLIPRTFSMDGDWDYDGVSLLPNTSGTGAYRISDIEQCIHKYINKIPLYGTATTYVPFTSDDTSYIPPGFFVRIKCVNFSDSSWTANVFMEIYRERTYVP